MLVTKFSLVVQSYFNDWHGTLTHIYEKKMHFLFCTEACELKCCKNFFNLKHDWLSYAYAYEMQIIVIRTYYDAA